MTNTQDEFDDKVVAELEKAGFTNIIKQVPIPRDPKPHPSYEDFVAKAMTNPPIYQNDQYIRKALKIVAAHYNQFLPEGAEIKAEEFYIVWFAKTLQNWKALVSTDAVKGLYYEVTYDGNKQQSYVDAYFKQENQVFTDEYLDTL